MAHPAEWSRPYIAAIAVGMTAVIESGLIALHAPRWLLIVVIGVAILVMLWAFSHAPGVAHRFPWWFHAASRAKVRADRQTAHIQAIFDAEKEAYAILEVIEHFENMRVKNAVDYWSKKSWPSDYYTVPGATPQGRILCAVTGPPDGIQASTFNGWTAVCRIIHRHGAVYESRPVIFGSPHGFTTVFPDNFVPFAARPFLVGGHDIEWNVGGDVVCNRRIFTVDASGTLPSRPAM